MVQTHQNSCEADMTKPIPPQETEKIWHGSSDPQKVLQLQHREHPDWLHHCLVRQLLSLRPQGTTVRTAQYITGAKLPTIKDFYTRWCQRKALKIVKDPTPVIDCSLYYRMASVTGVQSLGQKGFSTDLTTKP